MGVRRGVGRGGTRGRVRGKQAGGERRTRGAVASGERALGEERRAVARASMESVRSGGGHGAHAGRQGTAADSLAALAGRGPPGSDWVSGEPPGLGRCRKDGDARGGRQRRAPGENPGEEDFADV